MAELTIIGCGNPVRADDGVGPRLVRYLWERGVPPNVKLVDGGTSGIDVIFHMEGSKKVIFVDACFTGGEPGSVYEVPVEEVQELPDPEEANLHSIKWFHAVALAKRFLNGKFPDEIRVFLIEGKNFGVGEELSTEVERSMIKLADFLLEKFIGKEGMSFKLYLDKNGYLTIPSDVAERFFSKSLTVAVIPQGMELHIYPLSNNKQGGLLLKRLNKKGDRAVLLWELLPPGIKDGYLSAVWDEERGALVVSLL